MSNHDCTKKLDEFLKGVDWSLLRTQKVDLAYGIRTATMFAPHRVESMEGIMNLLDSLQDAAADVLGEEAVFGPSS